MLGVDPAHVAIITGPNLAYELVQRQPAAAVAAASTTQLAHYIQKLFTTSYYRVYTSTDLLGCEMAGAVKSVIALGVGIAVGMGLGENTQSMLITRGLNEVARLGAAHGADPLSVAGLAGMGDLVASCSSPLSRNRTFWEALGRVEQWSMHVLMWQQPLKGLPLQAQLLNWPTVWASKFQSLKQLLMS